MPTPITSAWGIGLFERNHLAATFTSNKSVLAGALANLANRRLDSFVRLNGVSAVQLTMQLAGSRSITCLSTMGGNFTSSAQCRVQIASSNTFSGGALQYDTNPGGAGTYPSLYDVTLGGGYLFATYTPPFGKTSPILLTDVDNGSIPIPTGPWVRFTFEDSSNPDGYLQLSIADVGYFWQPASNFAEDWERGADPVGQASTGDSGFPLHKVLRWHKFSQDWFDPDESVAIRNHFLANGPNGRVLFIPQPLKKPYWLLDAIWGTMPDQPKFQAHPKMSWSPAYQTKLMFREVDE